MFIDYMRRVQVQSDEQFSATIFYIHKNPVHHGAVNRLDDWKWSSYKSFFSKGETSLQRDEVINMFQGIDAFAAFHQQTVYLKNAVVTED
ncbi:MAG: hypothetical protein AVDCRST_MAG96-4030 [uncultured Segetibacter sp.]|uniref:Transposase and inactivated derivatives n=1 Tax=uncultured Segetibacter sp. TaxID=481133 RepID=A0A6J4U3K9_9BACT|nr:MAG: hypothetical protein AVDCRST_MAG96-4030 [uncultured Segetibacter sp.]